MGRKKTYSKPCIKKISLSPEEAILSYCKTTTGTTGSGANKCQERASCRNLGS